MAYMSQEEKNKMAPKIKAICKKYGVKASLAVNNHSTLVLNIKSSPIDFIGESNKSLKDRHVDRSPITDHFQVNEYWFQEHFPSDSKSLSFLSEVIPAMNDGNWDKSDIQTDYFNVGWYISVNVGKWNKPYILEK